MCAIYTPTEGCQAEIRRQMKKNKAISVRVPDPVKKAAVAAAKADNRSLASFVEKILLDRLQELGWLK